MNLCRVKSWSMKYFGEMDMNWIHHTYVHLRYAKLMAGRRFCGLFIKMAGRFEELASGWLPGYKGDFFLPDFFVVGAQKSGTSSLTFWLNQLPEFNLAMMRVKWKKDPRSEIQFFSDPAIRLKRLKWYSEKFIPGKINGEKTPEYLPRKSALEEIHRFCPGAKIIVMLRNPVTRAFSGYQHYYRKVPRSHNWDWMLPGRSFEENLQAEEHTGFPIGILGRGRYAEQLDCLLSIFPKEQVKIIVFERCMKQPAEHLMETVCFLGGSPDNLDVSFTHSNKGVYSSEFKEETRRKLEDYYRPHNERLFKLLGFRIDEWDPE